MATYNYTVTASGNSYYLWNGHGLVDAQNPDLFFRSDDRIVITNASAGGGHPIRLTGTGGIEINQSSAGVIDANGLGMGEYTYECTSHPSAMNGKIIVSAAYANEGPEDGYGTGPLIGHDDGPLSMNEIRTKINEIISKGGVGGGSISVSQNAPPSPSDGDLWWDEDTASLYVYFTERNAWIQTNGGGGSGGVRAYVAFDGTVSGEVGSDLSRGITNSFNVSSVTDFGVGIYTVTYTSSISNPIIQATCCTIDNGIGEVSTTNNDTQSGSKTSVILATNRNGAARDAAYVSLIVH